MEKKSKETTKTTPVAEKAKAAAPAVKEAPKAAAPVKEEVKAAPAKAAKTEVKAAAKTTAKTEVKPAAKKTTAAKPAAKKTAEKKPAAKKAPEAKKEAVTVNLQFAGKSYTTEDLIAIAKDVWKYDLGKEADDFRKVELYVKPEENQAYYVINDEFTGSFFI